MWRLRVFDPLNFGDWLSFFLLISWTGKYRNTEKHAIHTADVSILRNSLSAWHASVCVGFVEMVVQTGDCYRCLWQCHSTTASCQLTSLAMPEWRCHLQWLMLQQLTEKLRVYMNCMLINVNCSIFHLLTIAMSCKLVDSCLLSTRTDCPFCHSWNFCIV